MSVYSQALKTHSRQRRLTKSIYMWITFSRMYAILPFNWFFWLLPQCYKHGLSKNYFCSDVCNGCLKLWELFINWHCQSLQTGSQENSGGDGLGCWVLRQQSQDWLHKPDPQGLQNGWKLPTQTMWAAGFHFSESPLTLLVFWYVGVS